jgi:drug/metabolite transporter (DMT)-like permease
MSVALRVGLQREPDAALATIATVVPALGVALVAAAAESPSRGVHLGDAWPFVLAGLLSPGAAQILVTYAIRDAGASRVSMVFGMAPLVSVTIAIVVLGEPVQVALVAGALFIVAGGIELARERDRPENLRRIGLLYAFIGATLFAIRDNLVRHLAVGRTTVPPAVAATAALAGGGILVALWAGSAAGQAGAARPRDRAPAALLGARRGVSRRWLPFVPAGLLFGASYVSLFEAYYRGRVTVVAPLVAVESLAGVVLSLIFLRDSERIGKRLILGAALIVAGGALIGAYR